MPRLNMSGGIYKTLSYRINTWVYPPGQRLTEEEISDEFKVSRSPVREALNMLAEASLIEKKEHKGYAVRHIDIREINELYDTRLVLELAVIKIVCKNGMDESLRSDLTQRWQQLYDTLPDMAEQTALEDERFHEILAEAAQNRVMQRMLNDIDQQIHFVRLSDITDPERLKTTCLDHLAILDAIARRDCETAASTIRRNIEWGKERVDTAIKEALVHAHCIT
jgi:DNA-binding GntR family transcriptional regulator